MISIDEHRRAPSSRLNLNSYLKAWVEREVAATAPSTSSALHFFGPLRWKASQSSGALRSRASPIGERLSLTIRLQKPLCARHHLSVACHLEVVFSYDETRSGVDVQWCSSNGAGGGGGRLSRYHPSDDLYIGEEHDNDEPASSAATAARPSNKGGADHHEVEKDHASSCSSSGPAAHAIIRLSTDAVEHLLLSSRVRGVVSTFRSGLDLVLQTWAALEVDCDAFASLSPRHGVVVPGSGGVVEVVESLCMYASSPLAASSPLLTASHHQPFVLGSPYSSNRGGSRGGGSAAQSFGSSNHHPVLHSESSMPPRRVAGAFFLPYGGVALWRTSRGLGMGERSASSSPDNVGVDGAAAAGSTVGVGAQASSKASCPPLSITMQRFLKESYNTHPFTTSMVSTNSFYRNTFLPSLLYPSMVLVPGHRWQQGAEEEIKAIYGHQDSMAECLSRWSDVVHLYPANGGAATVALAKTAKLCEERQLKEEEKMIRALSKLCDGHAVMPFFSRYVIVPAIRETVRALQKRRMAFLAGVLICNAILPTLMHRSQSPGSRVWIDDISRLPLKDFWASGYLSVLYVERVFRLWVRIQTAGRAGGLLHHCSTQLAEARVVKLALEQYIHNKPMTSLKELSVPQSVHLSSMESCAVCGLPLEEQDPNTAGMFVRRTGIQQRSTSPEPEPSRGTLVVRCFRCGHGGHLEHVIAWWKEGSVARCPMGCDCECVY